MKPRLCVSLIWVTGTFLVLSGLFYAANDYEQHMLAAITGKPGLVPTLDRARALEAQRLQAETIEEVHALNGEIGQEIVRHGNVMSASASRRHLIQRAWILWGISASVPLAFLWWPNLVALWRRLQPRSAADGRTAESVRI